jgi:dienelactone hydrolase
MEDAEGPRAKRTANLQASSEQYQNDSFLNSPIGRLLFRDEANGGVTVLESPTKDGAGLIGVGISTENSSNYRRTDVVALDVATGNARTIFSGPSVQRIHLSPDGRLMMIVGWLRSPSPSFASDLYVIPVNTIGDKQVSSLAKPLPPPDSRAFDPQGNVVAPMVKRASFFSLWHDESWSPNSDRIAYVEQGGGGDGDLMILDVKTGQLRNMTAALHLPEDARDQAYGTASRLRAFFRGKFSDEYIPPVWSRNGETLYVRRMHGLSRNIDMHAMRGELWAISARTGEARKLPIDPGVSVEAVLQRQGIAWDPETADKLLLAVRFGSDDASGFVRFDPGAGSMETISRFRGMATRPSIETARVEYAIAGKASNLVFLNERSDMPPELYSIDFSDGKIRQATDANREVAKRKVPEMRKITWTAADGEKAGGLLYLPPKSSRAGRSDKLPLILEVYPGNAVEFTSIHEERYAGKKYLPGQKNVLFRRLFDAGYAILFPDLPLKGEGKACSELTTNALKALDAAGHTGLIDMERVGIMGASFGGYTVNCVVTHTPRFQAAVSLSGISDLIAEDIDSGTSGGRQAKLGASFPKSGLDRYIADSPFYHADQVTTPLLLLHGKTDTSVPFTQSVRMFQALQRMGKTAKLIGYDGYQHSMPENEKTIGPVLEWFDRYLKPPQVTAPK